jgi:hypothetical protein
MQANVTEIAANAFCISTFHPEFGIPFNQFLVADEEPRARDAILENLSGPLAHDMPYTAQTNAALQRLALLHPQTLAAMHGSSFTGDGQKEIADLAAMLKATIGKGVESL